MYLPYISQYFQGKYTVKYCTVKGSVTFNHMSSYHNAQYENEYNFEIC